MSTRPTGSNPSRSRIGRDIEPAWVSRAGSAALPGLDPAGVDQRPVAAAAPLVRQRRAPEQRQPVWRRRAGSGADHVAVEPRRVHEARRVLLLVAHLRALVGDPLWRRAEGEPLDLLGGHVLLVCRDSAGDEAGRRWRRLVRERERDRDRVVVAASARGRAASSTSPSGCAALPTSHCVVVRPRSRSSPRTSSRTSSICSAVKRWRWTVLASFERSMQSV